MASTLEFVQFAMDQMAEAGEMTYRKMFGEYGVYCYGKIIGLICDDKLFIKITREGKDTFSFLEEAPPYPGAKPYFYIDEVEDRDLLVKLVTITYEALPVPKKKGRQNGKTRL